MAISFILLLSRQGKVRLAKWFATHSDREKAKAVREISTLVLGRKKGACAFVEWKDQTLVYRRYASLYFVFATPSSHYDNPLITLEIMHRYVQTLDAYFGNVCELDIVFGFEKAYLLLDEMFIAGELAEAGRRAAVQAVKDMEREEERDHVRDIERSLRDSGFI
ncbi:AP-1 complex subunit-like protein [Sphaerosporella brunnea]|uniref:AP complex subunit sigma n=1 Tax=Sphaerosporella brunnea TaxID=1250544 RepID=A0A5J5ESE0_9PEZI|nr:AP-1 complex subunit-like protein [Sphaerosporella brunnea]